MPIVLRSVLWHHSGVLNESTSTQLRREADELLETAAKLIEHAETLKAQAAELKKQSPNKSESHDSRAG